MDLLILIQGRDHPEVMFPEDALQGLQLQWLERLLLYGFSFYLDIQDMDASPGYGISFSTVLKRDCFDRDPRDWRVNCSVMGIIA